MANSHSGPINNSLFLAPFPFTASTKPALMYKVLKTYHTPVPLILKMNPEFWPLFSLYCPLYGLELVPGKHCHVEEMVKTIAWSITTTMSVCSGDKGYSREMGRGLTQDERDHPLKA